MSKIKEAIYAVLNAGNLGATIYPHEIRPGAAIPAIVYEQVGATRLLPNDGTISLSSIALAVNCYDDTYEGAKDSALAVRRLLNGYAATASGVVIHGIFLQDEHDLFTAAVGVEESKRFGRSLQFDIHYDEILAGPIITSAEKSGNCYTLIGTNFGATQGSGKAEYRRRPDANTTTWTELSIDSPPGWADTYLACQGHVAGDCVRILNDDNDISNMYDVCPNPAILTATKDGADAILTGEGFGDTQGTGTVEYYNGGGWSSFTGIIWTNNEIRGSVHPASTKARMTNDCGVSSSEKSF